MSGAPLKTRIATADEQSVTIRGKDLIREIIGRCSYTDMVYFLITDRMPMPAQTRIFDACLVTLMEHGMTPSAIITRLVQDNVPGEAQVAMAAGLLSVGSVIVGTIEGCAELLVQGASTNLAPAAYAEAIVADHAARKAPLAGFGHRLHKPDDPRAQRLLELAEELGVAGSHVALLREVGAALDRKSGRHVTINATGAIAALLLEIGIPIGAMRALAVVSRAGGLPGHILEERQTGSGRQIWRLVDDSFAYDGA